MDETKDDIARRFMAMVDEFYERKVKLIISAEVYMEGLYSCGCSSFDFQGCLSRLQGILSRDYLSVAHLP